MANRRDRLDSQLDGAIDDRDPDFAADSISMPPETAPRPSSPAKRPSYLPMIAIGVALVIALAVIGGALLRSGDRPEAMAIDPVPQAAAPAPAVEPPPPAEPPPDPPAPAPVEVEKKPKPSKKKATKKKKRRRRASTRALDAKLDSAFEKLEDLDDRPSPTPAEPGSEGEGVEDGRPRAEPTESGGEVAAQGTSPVSAEVSCSNGDAAACVRAGRAKERSTDSSGGARARQLYGVACMKGSGEGCFRLARLLEGGIGGAQDPMRARALKKKACELGHRRSCSDGTVTATAAR